MVIPGDNSDGIRKGGLRKEASVNVRLGVIHEEESGALGVTFTENFDEPPGVMLMSVDNELAETTDADDEGDGVGEGIGSDDDDEDGHLDSKHDEGVWKGNGNEKETIEVAERTGSELEDLLTMQRSERNVRRVLMREIRKRKKRGEDAGLPATPLQFRLQLMAAVAEMVEAGVYDQSFERRSREYKYLLEDDYGIDDEESTMQEEPEVVCLTNGFEVLDNLDDFTIISDVPRTRDKQPAAEGTRKRTLVRRRKEGRGVRGAEQRGENRNNERRNKGKSATVTVTKDTRRLNMCDQKDGSLRVHLFYDSESPFSHWHPSPFRAYSRKDGKEVQFQCMEQYLMFCKARFFKDEEMASKILQEPDPAICKRFGREVKGFKYDLWVDKRSQVVRDGNYCKFYQNPGLLQQLLDTKGTLAEASPRDSIYGIGLGMHDPRAKNMNE